MKKQRSNTGNERRIFYNIGKNSREAVDSVVTNDDLLGEILFRVPTKSLMKFKCVSKHWLSLISDPKFCSVQSRINITPPVDGFFFRYRDDPDMNYVSLSKLGSSLPPQARKYRPHYTLEHVSHGIALYSRDCENDPLVVCNIATQERKALPKRRHNLEYCNQSSFIFLDPMKSFHYRVIVVIGILVGYEIEVYSSETQSWKYFEFDVLPDDELTNKVLCNGAIYWIKSKNLHVRFEIDAEKLIANRLPPDPNIVDKKSIHYFDEYDGSLLLITYVYTSWYDDGGLKIFEMDKDYYGWTVKLSNVCTKPLKYTFCQRASRRFLGVTRKLTNCEKYYRSGTLRFPVISFVNRGDKNGDHILFVVPGKVVSYSLALKKFELLQEFPLRQFSPDKDYDYVHAYPFQPTLISPI